MLWDKYFFEEAIDKIINNQTIAVQHINFDEFNKKAVEYAKTIDKLEIIDLTIHFRNKILQHLNIISEEDFSKERFDGDGHEFSINNYLVDFISHDTQHINQLKSFLSEFQIS
jgi:hypothetical protein